MHISTIAEHFLWRSWWVVIFILLCCILFEHAVYPQKQEYAKLAAHLKELSIEKDQALQLQAELLMQVNSQSDPAWIELTLMKGLGLTPEDQTKVFFTKP